MQFKAVHIEGRSNFIADAISRKQWHRFRMVAPQADRGDTNSRNFSAADFRSEIDRLVDASLASNTKDTYRTGLRSFEIFRKDFVIRHMNLCFFAAAFSVAFHGFLRVGELVYTKLDQAQNIISIHGTQILCGAKGEFIRLHLTHSKGDQTGKGISFDIRKTDSPVCPIQLLKRYLTVRPNKNGPLLCHFSGKYVSRYQFSGILSKALNVIGIDSSGYKSHSFRIGAASEASAKEISNEEVMKLGRWKSVAYRSYIRL
ncbi:unnamed protein product [Mytilus coruscus]|uniref:Tyr recombinase domain-containing protein n=1 Tax=Mytilus coruscus TaxID=42192 RepID=A0A6J8CH07_MYTCO|nr:unnamed protein product [Mytilus coruscus]